MTAKPKKPSKTSKVSTRKRDNDRAFYLASLLDNISDALISTDMEFKVLEWNTAAEIMYGWTEAEVIGHPIQEFIQSEYETTTQEDMVQTVLDVGTWEGEVTQNRKDGTHFPVMASVSRVKDKTGKPIGFVTINRDITDRKQTESDLRQSEEKFSILFKRAPFAAQLARLPAGAIVEVNEEFEKLVGYSREELIGKTSLELNLYPDPETRARMVAEVQARGFSRNAELEFRTKLGELRHLLISTDFIEIGREKHVLTTAQDITERRRRLAKAKNFSVKHFVPALLP